MPEGRYAANHGHDCQVCAVDGGLASASDQLKADGRSMAVRSLVGDGAL